MSSPTRRPRRPAWLAGTRPRWIPLLALLAVVVLGLALAAGTAGTGTDNAGQPATRAPGTAAPPLAGQTLTGERFDLATLRGQVVLVNVFASWCAPCRAELPLLIAAQRRWSAQGLRVVGVDVRDSTESVHALLDETQAQDLTVLPDPAGTTAVEWGARGVPETFLVDRNGRVVQWAQGPLTAQWVDQRLAPLLAP